MHLTGSDKTFEAVVFGPGPDGARRKATGTPLLGKPVTGELNNLSPVTARRMSSRTDSSSDADPWVATRMAAAQAPWPDAIIIDMSASGPHDPASWPAELIQRALAAIRPHEPEYAAHTRPRMLAD